MAQTSDGEYGDADAETSGRVEEDHVCRGDDVQGPANPDGPAEMTEFCGDDADDRGDDACHCRDKGQVGSNHAGA